MTSKDTVHFLLAAFPSWDQRLCSSSRMIALTPFTGRTRPLCQFALRLLDFNEKIVVTILTGPNMLAKAQAEIATNVPGGTTSRLRSLPNYWWSAPRY